MRHQDPRSELNLTTFHAKLQLVSALSAWKKKIYIYTYIRTDTYMMHKQSSFKYHEYGYDTLFF